MIINDEETFDLDPEQEKELLTAIAEAERGDFVNAADLLKKVSTV